MAFQNSEMDSDLENMDRQVSNPKLERKTSKGKPSFSTLVKNAEDTQVLVFKHNTKAQERTRKRQQPRKLEPLVSSKPNIVATLGYRGSCKTALGRDGIFLDTYQRRNENLKVKTCLWSCKHNYLF